MSGTPYDLAVVGGGPAGLAGAAAATRAGLRVALIDGGARLGGQYFRHPAEGLHAANPAGPHHGFARFTRLREGVSERAEVFTRHRVWSVERGEDGTVAVHCLVGDREERPRAITARRLLIATGAYDRSLPFPGWDLPGVLTAGGAQALLKGDLVTAGRRVVVAGTGPFLLPVGAGLAAAGARVLGVFEAAALPGVARRARLTPGKVAEAAGYALTLARHRTPFRGGHAVIAAHGGTELTHVTLAQVDADWHPLRTRVIACDTLAVGYGFVAQLDLPVQLGCATVPGADGDPVVAVDAGLRTSVPGVYAAGETTGVGGSELAEVEGLIAGRTAAADLGRAVAPAPALSARRDRLAAFAAALARAYPVRDGWMGWLRPDTLVCRCEEVPYARVVEARELGARDARAVKLLARPGMGWCQGRVCGHAVARLAGETPRPPRRPFAQPVRLGDLAASGAEPSDERNP
ncbi:oxidase [Microtetraspora sp. NBRC 13810]|uniref:FAD/NAD(P)-dependent oxidoreductase n=1 Tax=Microtetraspora sp. NBRC 13810 TaxID=3030990 RepID=UPI0024A03CD3|nr:NAD(P)/FAD-dependent oxidoreductase [Microtetraspora sp. NBRC 13810]GLW08335.1 oxidase [Microtetraspora sp. NBRC 13810]